MHVKDFDTEDHRQVTLGHILMAITLCIPSAAVITEVRAAHGRPLQYLLGVPLAVALGCLLVFLEWHSGRFLWGRSQPHSDRIQRIATAALFALQFVWIVLADLCGAGLAHWAIKFSVSFT
jgi:hypothetical protein